MTISAGEKNLSFWQLASVVIQEGEESCTTKKMPEMLQRFSEGKKEKKAMTNCEWRQFAGKASEGDGKRSICARNVGILLPKKTWSKEVSRAG